MILQYLGGGRGPGTSILPHHVLSLFIFPLSHPFETRLEALWEHASVFSKGVVHFWMLTNKLFLQGSVCCMDLLSTLFTSAFAAPRNGEHSSSFVWLY